LPDCFAGDFAGYSGGSARSCAAIQLEYDVLSRQIHYLSIGSARQSDKTVADERMNYIGKGELVLRDLGYYSIDSYLKIEKREAFYVSRLKSQVCIYQQKGGEYEPLSWSAILQRLQNKKEDCFDQWVFIGKEQKHPVRLMAWILPGEDQRKRLQKKKNKKGTISKNDITWSKLNVFISNIDSNTMDAQQLYHLYKIRWQIELMFKIWKSILYIASVRKMKASRLRCYLYSKFIWVLICWDITGMAESVTWKSGRKLISLYKCMAILKIKAIELKNILSGSRELLKAWLIKIIKVLSMYGCKEDRKKRLKLSDLLQLK
jgi:hypothetical protein